MPVEKQVFIIWTVSNGLADDIEVDDLKRFEAEIFEFIENAHPSVFANAARRKNQSTTI